MPKKLTPEVVAKTPDVSMAELEPHRRPHIVRLGDVEPEAVQWLWEPYIPLRKLTLLEGDPGVGKTWLALQIAASLSQGYALPGPDGWPGGPGGQGSPVLYLSAEDGIADTLRPRLDAAGADCTRIHALVGWRGQDAKGQAQHGAIMLSDVAILEEAMAEIQPVLVIIDPLQGYLGATVDMHRANEVRPILTGLSTLAETYACAVLAIRHLGKAPQSRAMYRGLGSIDFAAAARSILLAGQDPRDPTRRVLAHVKSSLALAGVALGYELRRSTFAWTGLSSITAEELLAPYHDDEERSAIDEATDFLQDILAEGPKPAQEVIKAAKQAGITEITLRRAKKAAGVGAHRQNAEGHERGKGGWVWQLQDDQDDQEPISPLKAYDDHHEQSLQSQQQQRHTDIIQDDQMITLNGSTYTKEKQALPGNIQGDHGMPLGERVAQGGQDDHLVSHPLRGAR